MPSIPPPGRYLLHLGQLNQACGAAGVPLDELAGRAGVSLRTLQRARAGRPVYRETLRRLALALAVPADHLKANGPPVADPVWREMHPDRPDEYAAVNLGSQRQIGRTEEVRLASRCPTLRVLTRRVMEAHFRQQLAGLREADPGEAMRVEQAHLRLYEVHRQAFMDVRPGTGRPVVNVMAEADFRRLLVRADPYYHCTAGDVADYLDHLVRECLPRGYQLVLLDRPGGLAGLLATFDTVAVVGNRLAIRRSMWNYQIEWSGDQDRLIRRHHDALSSLLVGRCPVTIETLDAYRRAVERVRRRVGDGPTDEWATALGAALPPPVNPA